MENGDEKQDNAPSQSELKDGLSCSFCAKGQKQVRTLIAGPALCLCGNAYICNECVMLCFDVLREELDKAMKGMTALREIAR